MESKENIHLLRVFECNEALKIYDQNIMKLGQDILREIDERLTEEIRSRQGRIIEKLGDRLEEDYYSFQRFNGLFGGKNNTYVDSRRTQFSDFNDFYSQWLKGCVDQYESRLKYGPQPNHNAVLLKNKQLEEFVKLFLERNFYRYLYPRTRIKPIEQLWEIWFGYQVVFGLLIAPIRFKNKWLINSSKISKVTYEYWTIGHVFQEGLIDNDSDKPFPIRTLDQFESIYLSIFKKLSSSKYEKYFCEKYIDYLKRSKNILEEPFLIPELRYEGFEKSHRYRLDFTILNPHTCQYTGFEISPSSSHMSVNGYKEKQFQVNNELREKWNKEMTKRNQYFSKYGISIITFTDLMLDNLDDCWNIIQEKLSARSVEKTSVHDQLLRIEKL